MILSKEFFNLMQLVSNQCVTDIYPEWAIPILFPWERKQVRRKRPLEHRIHIFSMRMGNMFLWNTLPSKTIWPQKSNQT